MYVFLSPSNSLGRSQGNIEGEETWESTVIKHSALYFYAWQHFENLAHIIIHKPHHSLIQSLSLGVQKLTFLQVI
jgi:hypothetical protein